MADIKTRDSVRNIKVPDNSVEIGGYMKDVAIRSKERIDSIANDQEASPSEYAESSIQAAANDTISEAGKEVQRQLDKRIEQGRNAYREYRQEVRAERRTQKVNNALQRYDHDYEASVIRTKRQMPIRGRERTVKTIKKKAKSVYTKPKKAIKTIETGAKTAEKTAETTTKAARTSARAAKAAAKAAETTAKAVAKAVVEMVKTIIAGLKSLVAAIAAGGWVAVVIIVVLCVVALIIGSCYGIFFPEQGDGSGQTIYEAVEEVEDEL